MSSNTFLTWYLSQLAAAPLQTKACTSGVLSGLQELTAQKVSGQKLDKRILKMAAYGLLVAGPLNHYWYELMNKVFAGKTGTKVKIGQLLFQNFIISPFMNSVFTTAMAMMAGITSPAALKANLKNRLLSMQKVSWVTSPLSMIFAQNFLPVHTWVPFFNIVIFCVGTYLNTMMKRKLMQDQKQQEKKE
ncbi:hypothetical protein K501DRAFT_322184 [Backusella circina FSU 941]|nr:hypothetical protein K501DRAFT_322184 [Backusella circina FSU 941]